MMDGVNFHGRLVFRLSLFSQVLNSHRFKVYPVGRKYGYNALVAGATSRQDPRALHQDRFICITQKLKRRPGSRYR